MKVSSPFIQSVYSGRVRASASGSACAEKLAWGVQYAWHPSQPLPASQASKNCLATAVMFDISLSSFRESKSAAGTSPAAVSLGCPVVKDKVLALLAALLTSLKSPGQEYRDVSAATLVKVADEIGFHDHSDVIEIVGARHLNFAVRVSTPQLRRG